MISLTRKISRKIIRLVNKKRANLGNGVTIRGFLKSDHPDHIYIDDNSFISYNCYFHFGDQLKSDTRIAIGKNVFFGPKYSSQRQLTQ